MQAVQTVGSMRYQHRYRNKHTIAISVFKKLIIPLVLIFTIMFAVFIPTGADVYDTVVMSVSSTRSTAQSAAHTLYATQATKRNVNDGGPTNPIDTSEFYADAAGVVPAYNSSLRVGTTSGLVVSLNSPTQQPAPGSFVTNVRSIVALEFEEIVQVEKNLGGSGNIDIQAAVDAFLSSSYMFGGNHYDGSSYSAGGPLRGAVGPALLDRNYYSGDKWAQQNSNSGMWDTITRGSGRINLMLVKPEDAQRYWAGEDVDVYYVEYGVVDAKGHCAPWGLNQTYMTNRADSNALSSWPNPGGAGDRSDVVTAPKQGSRVDTVTALWEKIRQTGTTQYWLPYVSASSAELGLQSVTTDYGTPIYKGVTANLFESGKGAAFDEFSKMFSGYTLVGVLVLADK